MSKILYIIRGLPGSGKSTLGSLLKGVVTISADEFFEDKQSGKYNFDKSKIKEAHEWCYKAVASMMGFNIPVAVANTFTRSWEYKPYLKLAKEKGFEPIIVTVASNFKSIHNVPDEVVDDMRNRFEYTPVLDFYKED